MSTFTTMAIDDHMNVNKIGGIEKGITWIGGKVPQPHFSFLQMISLSHTTPHAGLYHTQHTRCPLDPHGPQDQY